MDMERYLSRHGTPPLKVEWGYREIGKDSEVPEPIILIDCTSPMEGYGPFVYETFGMSEELRLAWTPIRSGWYIDPILNNQVLPPPLVVCGFDPTGWKAAIERRRCREITTLWKCGCSVLLRIRDERRNTDVPSEAILFDKFDSYGLLDSKRTMELMFKLDEPEYPFETLQYWSSAGMDS